MGLGWIFGFWCRSWVRKSVVSVCSDLYEGFINSAKEVFGKNIRIVIDRFHVAKLYRKYVDTIRKEETRRLKKELSEDEYSKLKGLMWALRKSTLSEKEKEILKIAFKHSAKLKEVYELSCKLTEIFNTKTTRNGGIRRLRNWISKVEERGITCFKTFIGTLDKWMEEIVQIILYKERTVDLLRDSIIVLKFLSVVVMESLIESISLGVSL